MSFADAVRSVLSKYADFNGRARRSEYWFWALAVFIVVFVLEVLSFAVHPLIFLLVIALLGLLVPNLAVGVRRMHDIGKSGWFLLIGLVPLVGGILLLVFSCQDSQPGNNHYGPNPKGVGGGYGGMGGPPPGYGQPQYGQPQYAQPPAAQPQYGQPPAAQPQYGQPQYAPPPAAAPPPYAAPPVAQPPYGAPPAAQPPYAAPPAQPPTALPPTQLPPTQLPPPPGAPGPYQP